MRAPTALISITAFHSGEWSRNLGQTVPSGQERVEVVFEGRGWVREAQGELREVSPGDIIWHMPGDGTIEKTDFDDPYACANFMFASPDAQLGGPRRVRRMARWEEQDAILRFSDQVVPLFYDDRFDRDVLLGLVFSRLLFEVEMSARREERQALPKPLQSALGMLQARFSEQIKIEEISDAAGWSVPHLHASFREHLKTSPHQELIRLRVQAARHMLASTDEPVKFVAAECGFSSDAAFCHTFRKIVGQTPLQFRSKIRSR